MSQFEEAVRSVLSDTLNLPPEFLNYLNQWQALNPIADGQEKIVRPNVFNLKEHGRATGDGISDDSAAIANLTDAITKGGGNAILYVPKGTYRVAKNGNGIGFSAVSNVAVYFEPGAKLLMDNLSGSSGTGHGVSFINGGSNIWVVNAHIEWNGSPSRSLGDGFHFICGTETGDPATTVNPMGNVNLINCFAVNCPQTGAIFQGVGEPRVFNFSVKNNHADGCHFNACHRINVNGVKGYQTGDDTLAFVTYYDSSNQTNHFASSIFWRAGLGDWCNSGSATNVHAESGAANGVRIAFAYNLAVSNVTAFNCAAGGIILDAAGDSPPASQTWGASQGVSVDNVVAQGCDTGIQCQLLNQTFSGPSIWWQYDVQITNFVARQCANHSLYVNAVAGLSIDGVRANGNDITIFGRDLVLDNLYCEGDNIFVGGTSVSYPNLSSTNRDNIVIGHAHAKGTGAGGTIQLSDVGSISAGTLRSTSAQSSGVQILRGVNVTVEQVIVTLPNRANAASTRGLYIAKGWHVDVQTYRLDHDANTLNSVEIGGGDATDQAARDVRVEKGTYVNTKNQTGGDLIFQSGATGANDYVVHVRFYNGGEASPIWREQRFGATSWAEHFINAGAPAIVANVGSTYQRTDGGTSTTLYVKESGNGTSTGWVAK